jgi:hypothetical protein
MEAKAFWYCDAIEQVEANNNCKTFWSCDTIEQYIRALKEWTKQYREIREQWCVRFVSGPNEIFARRKVSMREIGEDIQWKVSVMSTAPNDTSPFERLNILKEYLNIDPSHIVLEYLPFRTATFSGMLQEVIYDLRIHFESDMKPCLSLVDEKTVLEDNAYVKRTCTSITHFCQNLRKMYPYPQQAPCMFRKPTLYHSLCCGYDIVVRMGTNSHTAAPDEIVYDWETEVSVFPSRRVIPAREKEIVSRTVYKLHNVCCVATWKAWQVLHTSEAVQNRSDTKVADTNIHEKDNPDVVTLVSFLIVVAAGLRLWKLASL